MDVSILDVNGIGPAVAKTLAEHRINSVEELAAISVAELTAVPGFGPARAQNAINAASAILAQNTLDTGEETVAKANTPVTPKIIEESDKMAETSIDSKSKSKKAKADKKKKKDKKKDKKSSKKGGKRSKKK